MALLFSLLGACTAGTYGLDCSYTCHCDALNCDDVTGCSGNCNEGWSGPNCTRENVALGKATTQSSYQPNTWANSSLAVDGNLTEGFSGRYCILTGFTDASTWWQLDLGRKYYTHKLAVHFRTDYNIRRNGVRVYSSVDVNQTNTGHLCGSTTLDSPDVTWMTCNDTARYITLYQATTNISPGDITGTGDRAMDFCEVQVFVCDAGTFGDDCSQFCHCLNGTCNYVTGDCTGGCKPNWTGTSCSECDSDHYGPLCDKSCSGRHCDESLGKSSCDKLTGRCDNGCTTGWMEQDCTKGCDSEHFGVNCQTACADRHCKGEQLCNNELGHCVGGCLPGWTGLTCTEGCDSEHFGVNCQTACADRHCKGEQLCNNELGHCVGGCLPGWTGLTCTEALAATDTEDHGDIIIIALAAGAGLLLLILIIVSCILCWYIRRQKKLPTDREATHVKNNIANKASVFDAVGYNTELGKYNGSSTPENTYSEVEDTTQQKKTYQGTANVVAQTSHYSTPNEPAGYVNANQTNGYAKLDSLQVQQNDYAKLGVI
ncbi:multiple epidermal growth factor-like domains protein 10 [Gigantopelta aegis]|uniref:multiple epidermal growth factor-like domains protein 10 n=1 Tax=Gigantopelta aegis TaxID=1735272 RepID=UPI001B88A3AC|nr:multiple epidermal growth factor-like domains protein 10 [Gigantopelta aegis]